MTESEEINEKLTQIAIEIVWKEGKTMLDAYQRIQNWAGDCITLLNESTARIHQKV